MAAADCIPVNNIAKEAEDIKKVTFCSFHWFFHFKLFLQIQEEGDSTDDTTCIKNGKTEGMIFCLDIILFIIPFSLEECPAENPPETTSDNSNTNSSEPQTNDSNEACTEEEPAVASEEKTDERINGEAKPSVEDADESNDTEEGDEKVTAVKRPAEDVEEAVEEPAKKPYEAEKPEEAKTE